MILLFIATGYGNDNIGVHILRSSYFQHFWREFQTQTWYIVVVCVYRMCVDKFRLEAAFVSTIIHEVCFLHQSSDIIRCIGAGWFENNIDWLTASFT